MVLVERTVCSLCLGVKHINLYITHSIGFRGIIDTFFLGLMGILSFLMPPFLLGLSIFKVYIIF